MKKWIIFFLMSLIGFSGCQTTTGNEAQKPADMDPEELPGARAFQDEFTREFLQSTEETRDGYYPFLSGTGRYEMDFPAGGVIGEESYAEKDNGYEGLLLGVDEGDGHESSININYYSHHELGNESNILDQLSNRLGMELEFKHKEDENKFIHYASFDYEEYESFGIAANVLNKLDSGAIQIVYTTGCETEEGCIISEESMREKMNAWIDSIYFIESEEHK
ncbi:hypothetical protein [Virgibacillus kimchii]